MNTSSKETNQKKGKRSKQRYIILLASFTIVILVLVVIVFIKQYNSTQTENNKHTQSRGVYKGGSGGDPKQVVSLKDQAVKAWKDGDKQKAKNLADQALKANEQLTSDQQKSIPGQIDMMITLVAIKKGQEQL